MKKIFSTGILMLFTVFAFVKANAQSTDEYKLNEKALHPPPVPNFYISGLCYGDTTFFFNKTDLGEIYWAITNDKGDTLFSEKNENIKYFFKKKGIYNICLTADNGHIATKIRTVLVDTITHADFYFRTCINEFDNQATCADQFIWTFPDNVTSTTTFPTYQFKKGGSFPVQLIAKKGSKANTITKIITVTSDSLGIPDATFTFKRHGTSNTFDLKAVDSLANQYNWTFGDRQFDDTSGYKVTHTFDMDKYDGPVSLRVANGCSFTFYEVDPFDVTGITDNYFLERNASVYPNPVNDAVNIVIENLKVSKVITIRLIDMNGAVVLENRAITMGTSYALQWNVTSFSKCIYLIQILTDGELLNKKIAVVQ